jgi:hypothetical protein
LEIVTMTVTRGTGLQAQYFNNRTLSGDPSLVRTDAAIHFNWSTGSPDALIHHTDFSARWSGQIQPLYSETYTFKTLSDDGVRLWINGKEVINDWTIHGFKADQGTIALEAGKKYDIKMEYYQHEGLASAHLLWSSRSQAEQIVPQSQLYAPQNMVQPVNPTTAKPVAAPQPARLAVSGTTYYVAANGSDANPGTIDRPLQTLQAAVNKVQPGEQGTTIYMRGGTYNQGAWIGDNHSGTEKGRLVIQPYQNEHVTIDGAGLTIGGQYVDIKGLEIKNTPKDPAINGWGARHLRILNNTVHDIPTTGIQLIAPDINQSGDSLISGNRVYHTNLARSAEMWGQGISAFTANNVVSNNIVYENYGEGISVGINGVIKDNIVHDNYSVEVYLSDTRNVTVEGNYIYNTGKTEFFRDDVAASGIQIANEGAIFFQNQVGDKLNHLAIRNNTVVGGRAGFFYGDYMQSGGMKNSEITNNTFVGDRTTKEGLLWIQDAEHQNNVIKDNIFDRGSATVTDLTHLPDLKGGFQFNHNLWSGGTADKIATSGSDLIGDRRSMDTAALAIGATQNSLAPL